VALRSVLRVDLLTPRVLLDYLRALYHFLTNSYLLGHDRFSITISSSVTGTTTSF
jgi:hypothetical protein